MTLSALYRWYSVLSREDKEFLYLCGRKEAKQSKLEDWLNQSGNQITKEI